MESYEFGLVSKLCQSRNELMQSFPSVIKEIRFLTTISKKFRHHPWVIWSSTWLYWLLGRGYTRCPQLLSTNQIAAEESVINISNSRGGVEYSDVFLHDNDARFVFNFIRSAIDEGCVAANYVSSIGAQQVDHRWQINAQDTETKHQFSINSKVLINATGAFVDSYNKMLAVSTIHHYIFSKGIHLLVPRITQSKRVLAFFADDGRLFFVIPMGNQSCIGTTDTKVDDPNVFVSQADCDFVLSNINANLKLAQPLTYDDIIAKRCGVRPLVVKKGVKANTDFLQLSRKHIIEANKELKHISIFGGKLTDCLNIGEEIAAEISTMGIELSHDKCTWYGEPDKNQYQNYHTFARRLGLYQIFAQDAGESVAIRLWRRYGQDAIAMLESIQQDPNMLKSAIEKTGVRCCKIAHLANREMIVHLQDFLRRCSKIELLYSREYLYESKGLQGVCNHLFGEQAKVRWQEYFNKHSPQKAEKNQ